MQKAVFIDKDGTLIRDVPYNVHPGRIFLNEGIPAFLQSVNALGYLVICISNQGGVAKGYFSPEDLIPVNKRINEMLHPYGTRIDEFYYCFHDKAGTVQPYTTDCMCRKPRPGLLLQAAADWDIDLSRSWMIGDILSDTEAGNAAGCHTILLDNGNETEWKLSRQNIPSFIVRHVERAAHIVSSMNTPVT